MEKRRRALWKPSDKPLTKSERADWRNQFRIETPPVKDGPPLTKKQSFTLRVKQRFEIVGNVYLGLLNNNNVARMPEPEECIPYLTDKHGKGRFIWVRENLNIKIETQNDLINFVLMLRKIGGIKLKRCPKCGTNLPVIKTINADEHRHVYYEWQTYCPWCSWIQPVIKSEDAIDSICGDRPMPRFRS